LLATIIARPYPFADRVKRAPAFRLVTVIPENRNELPAAGVQMLAGRRPIAAQLVGPTGNNLTGTEEGVSA